MPKLVYLVAISALVIAALSLFFSPSDEIVYARIIGGPTDSPSGFHGRLQVLVERAGVAEPLPDRKSVV